MKVLVTGAGGFTGAEIVKTLRSAGHEVVAAGGSSQGDLAVDLALPRVDAIVHAAARSPAPGVSTDKMVHDNVVGTMRLIDHARRSGVQKFVFLSSLSVYGTIRDSIVDENTPINDPDPYGLSKLACERMLGKADAFASLAIRLPGVLGRGSVRNWMTGVLAEAREGREIAIYNGEAPFNNAAHVADIARFAGTLLDRQWSGFDAVTVAAGGKTTVRNAVRLVIEASASRSTIAERPARQTSFLVSSQRASSVYGYEPMQIEPLLRRFVSESLG